jgi:two-component system sensor histidine kinase KdpD
MRARALIASARRIGFGSVAVGLMALLGYRTHLELASAIPLYMLIVVVQSLTGDFAASAAICLLSALCLDFFFTQPYLSLYIRNFSDVLAVVAFLVTALVITRLMSRVREEAGAYKLERERLDRLYKLSQQLLALEPDAVMTEKFLAPFREAFGIAAISTFDGETTELRIVGESRSGLAEKTRTAFIAGHDVRDPAWHTSAQCLRRGGRAVGAVGFEGLEYPEQVSGSLAALTTALIERARAFRELSSAAAATQAEVYRSALLDALAHEFKTPLATILAAAGGIREAGPLGSDQLEMSATVENEALRLANLTSRLLRTARLDREDIRPRMETLNISFLAEQIAEHFKDHWPEHQIVMPESRSSAEVMADPELLRIALSQLVENACKYSAGGSTITLEIERHGEFIAARVSNTGSSIPSVDRYHIFERFFRGATNRGSTSGAGLGLYIARKIAAAHGGALDLETPASADDRVTFCLRIPVSKEVSVHVLAAK